MSSDLIKLFFQHSKHDSALTYKSVNDFYSLSGSKSLDCYYSDSVWEFVPALGRYYYFDEFSRIGSVTFWHFN